MSRLFHRQLCLPLILLVCGGSSVSLPAQTIAAPATTAQTASTPVLQPPLAFFRELLVMNAAQREQHLAQWTPEKRSRVLAKVSEYEAMSPAAREESLIATELHWYLQQFLLKSATNSGIDLSQVPEPYHKMVSDRLLLWKMLPPPLQQEVLTHDSTRNFFLLGGRKQLDPSVPPQIIPPPLREELLRLEILPPGQRQQTFARFQNFFELTSAEKQAVLDSLPSVERRKIEKTITNLEQLPPKQRNLALQSLAQVAGLTGEQQHEFFKNMGRWELLSADEKQLWLKLASHLPPMPPLPPPMPPPMPPPIPPLPSLSSATNPSP